MEFTEKEKQRIYQLLKSHYPTEQEIPGETVQLMLHDNGINYVDYGFKKGKMLIQEMSAYLSYRYISYGTNKNMMITVRSVPLRSDGSEKTAPADINSADVLKTDRLSDYRQEIYALLAKEFEFGTEYPFSAVALYLNQNGFPKERFGFSRMHHLLGELSEFINMESRTINGCPQKFVTLRERPDFHVTRTANLTEQSKTDAWREREEEREEDDADEDTSAVKPRYKLENFAFVDWNRLLPNLAELAQNEKWGFSDDAEDYSILQSYICYTYDRLVYEDKISFSEDGKYAAMNTGLVNSTYDDIFLLFELTAGHNICVGCCCAGSEPYGKTLFSQIDFNTNYPERAAYFQNLSDLIMDTSKTVMLDKKHIIKDNVNRFPAPYLCAVFTAAKSKNGLSTEDAALYDTALTALGALQNDTVPNEMQRAHWRTVRDCIDDLVYNKIGEELENAVRHAVKTINLNYRIAIPSYFPTKQTMSLLIPLSLQLSTEKPDVVLTLSRVPSGNYQGETILSLEMAYTDARLICKPQSDWLSL